MIQKGPTWQRGSRRRKMGAPAVVDQESFQRQRVNWKFVFDQNCSDNFHRYPPFLPAPELLGITGHFIRHCFENCVVVPILTFRIRLPAHLSSDIVGHEWWWPWYECCGGSSNGCCNDACITSPKRCMNDLESVLIHLTDWWLDNDFPSLYCMYIFVHSGGI